MQKRHRGRFAVLCLLHDRVEQHGRRYRLVERKRLDKFELAVGDRPRLVEKQHVRTRQHLDAVEVAGERVLARHLEHRRGKRRRRQEEHADRDHAQHTARHRNDRVPPRSADSDAFGDQQERREYHEHDRDALDQRVEHRKDLALGLAYALCYARHALDIPVLSDPVRKTARLARMDCAPGKYRVARSLADGARFARQNRFVDLNLAALDGGIGRHLRACGYIVDVVEHELLRRDRRALTVADDVADRPPDQRQPVDGALGFELLPNADCDVDEDDARRDRIIPRADCD